MGFTASLIHERLRDGHRFLGVLSTVALQSLEKIKLCGGLSVSFRGNGMRDFNKWTSKQKSGRTLLQIFERQACVVIFSRFHFFI